MANTQSLPLYRPKGSGLFHTIAEYTTFEHAGKLGSIYSISAARHGAGLTLARRAVIGARGKSHTSCPRGLLRCVVSRVVWELDTEATPTTLLMSCSSEYARPESNNVFV